ncbi:MAG: site-specific DNA-methyltransferase [Planctomycetota bacterium]|nr:site-specific DNA-methyltransferase [Planctomycetota bacterium]
MAVCTEQDKLTGYLQGTDRQPLFLCGNSLKILRQFPDEAVDFAMTSPPYWGHRKYDTEGLGQEEIYAEYVESLGEICAELHRVLRKTGSFWLNIGDSYQDKRLLGIPWRVAFHLTDQQGWILRNDVIWNKVKGGPDNSTDKLRNVHEYVFHFVKATKGYYYNADAIRSSPQKTKVVHGAIVSATGVSGVRYKRQIELSTALQETEKKSAFEALEAMLQQVRDGGIADFRMIIRGQQRTTHSDSEHVSGRARELQEKGFYFLRYHPNGAKPKDVWDIMPEDTQNRKSHFAPYPEDLCKIPILCTCPEDGIVLDPFCGTGTTMSVAFALNRKSVGIDISTGYIKAARERCRFLI